MRNKPLVVLKYKGHPVKFIDDWGSLTQLWKLAGSPPNRRPTDWIPQVQAQRFIEALEVKLGVQSVKTKSGGSTGVGKNHSGEDRNIGGGETTAHWQVCMTYAEYLSPELHMWFHQIVKTHMQDRGPAWHVNREEGISVFKELNNAIAATGNKGQNDYIIIHQHGNLGFMGGVASQIKKAAGVSSKAKTRNTFTSSELAGKRLQESLTLEEVVDNSLFNTFDIARANRCNGLSVRNAIMQAKDRARADSDIVAISS